MMAIALTAMMGAVALSVDVGSVVLAIQRAQYVADMAALAAAQAQLPGADHTAALASVGDVITGNNPPTGPQVTWQSGETSFYSSGATVPKYGQLTSSQSAAQVITHLPVTFTFARALGLTGTTVTRKATALRQLTLLPCIFAHGPASSSLEGVVWPGSSITVNGDVWSNANVTINGTSNVIDGNLHADTALTVTNGANMVTGAAQYVTTSSISGSSPKVVPTQVTGGVQDYPINYTFADLAPYTYEYSSYSVNTSGSVVPPGIYRVHGTSRPAM